MSQISFITLKIMIMKKYFFILSAFFLLVGMSFLIYQNYFSDTSEQTATTASLSTLQKPKGILKALKHLYELKANQVTGEVAIKDVYAARRQANQLKLEKSNCETEAIEWEYMGPNNVGGRTRTLVIDKDDHQRLYTGGVAGGIWTSKNGGLSWQAYPGNEDLASMSIACMTQTADGVLLVGTGEFMAGFSYGIQSAYSAGNGIYRSTDRGETFEVIPVTDLGDYTAPPTSLDWSFVISIAAHPTDPNLIYAGTHRGLHVSRDGGDTWERPAGLTQLITIWDVKITSDGKDVYAAAGGGLYVSRNGEPFENITGKNGAYESSGRTKLGVAHSDPNYVYAITTDSRGCLAEVVQSKDGGYTWDRIGEGNAYFDPMGFGDGSCQGFYDIALAVDAFNPERIFVAGLVTWSWETNDGWRSIDQYWEGNGSPYYVHPDKHDIIFDTKNPDLVYIVSDGGVARSLDASNVQPTFQHINKNYNVTQFYSVGASFEGRVMGGTQDNTTPYIDFDGNSKKAGRELAGGDGGYAEISDINTQALFWESQNGAMNRSANNGDGGSSPLDINTDANSDGNLDTGPFVTAFFLWEDLNAYYFGDGSVKSRFFTGGTNGKLWYTPDALTFNKTPDWEEVTNIGGTLASMDFGSDGQTVYALSRGGDLARIKNFDTNRSVEIDRPSVLAGRRSTAIAIDRYNPGVIVLTAGNYGNNDHIFITEDAWQGTLEDLEFTSLQKDLPRMPIYDVVVEPDDPEHYIVVGTELGVWSYNKNTDCWTEQNAGMGRVPVHRVRLEDMNVVGCKVLYIGTHGRGIFRSTTLTSSFCAPEVTELPEYDTGFTTDVGEIDNNSTKEAFNINVFPNPVQVQATVEIQLPTTTQLILTVFDLQGKQVQQIDLGQRNAGKHNINWTREGLPTGTYLMRFQTADGQQKSVNIMLTN